MLKALIMGFITCSLIFSLPAQAQPKDSAKFSTCLVDSLNGKERKLLARWMYFIMATHPEMRKFANISAKERITTDKEIGKLVTRLLTKDCSEELIIAQKSGVLILEKAFEKVGEVAMMELMNNENVTNASQNFANYANTEAINKILK